MLHGQSIAQVTATCAEEFGLDDPGKIEKAYASIQESPLFRALFMVKDS